MKKLLTVLLMVLMLVSITACGSSSNTKEVNSTNDFYNIGITTMETPNDFAISDIKYYVVDKNIAEITFMNSGHKYSYRGSKEVGVGGIHGIEVEPIGKMSSVFNDVSYTLAAYPNGLLAVWIKDMITYSLFGEGLTVDNNYEFFRVIQVITGANVTEEPVTLPTIDNKTTKDYIMKWFEDNEFKDVDYEYENSDTVAEDVVIRLSKKGEAYPSDEIVCVISTGPKKPDIVTVPEDLINKTEADFIDALKKLGLGSTRSSTTYYSTTIKKGNVFEYDDGSFPAGTIIKYNLSRGPYEFDADEFNNKTKAEAQDLVAYLNKLNAHVELKLKEHVADKHKIGTVYKCSSEKDGIKTIVSCTLAIEETDRKVDLPNYVGGYNNPCGAKDACTVNEINYKIEYHDDGNPTGYISAQTVPAGKVEPGTCVKLIVSSPMVYLYRLESGAYNKLEGGSYEDTSEALKSPDFFGRFGRFNVDYMAAYNDAQPDGAILEIAIYDNALGRWNANYIEGNYSTDTPVRITINDLRDY